MNFERESWRPLFLREPLYQRGWSVMTRGLRCYLIGVAEDDGMLVKRCADPFELLRLLSARANEVELVRDAIGTLLDDGFLRWDGSEREPGWLGIHQLVTREMVEQPLAGRVRELRDLVGRLRKQAQRKRPVTPADTCAYCGKRSPRMTIDHVVPICQGGTNDIDNLVPACGECNSRKGGRTPEQAGMVLR